MSARIPRAGGRWKRDRGGAGRVAMQRLGRDTPEIHSENGANSPETERIDQFSATVITRL